MEKNRQGVTEECQSVRTGDAVRKRTIPLITWANAS